MFVITVCGAETSVLREFVPLAKPTVGYLCFFFLGEFVRESGSVKKRVLSLSSPGCHFDILMWFYVSQRRTSQQCLCTLSPKRSLQMFFHCMKGLVRPLFSSQGYKWVRSCWETSRGRNISGSATLVVHPLLFLPE